MNAMTLGIYVHIPFCASRCAYCDFYSTTQTTEIRAQFVLALCRELQQRCVEAKGRKVSSIYFGGGTPSQLHVDELSQILSAIRTSYSIAQDAEITVEANPDDVATDWVRSVQAMGVNRVSLGLQSFNDERLQLIRRRHSASEAVSAVHLLKDNGIHNISIDLIYALPGQSLAEWLQDVQQALSLPITHLSAYALSYEPSTLLHRWLSEGRVRATSDAMQEAMYRYLRKATRCAGFCHYELSNFCKPGYSSRHNSSYWQSVPYIGVGPGAHSYDGVCFRRGNEPNLKAYLQNREVPHSIEKLTRENLLDEMLLTNLRTARGLVLREMFRHTTQPHSVVQLLRAAHPWLRGTSRNKGKPELQIVDGSLRIAPHALFVSDALILQLSTQMEESLIKG